MNWVSALLILFTMVVYGVIHSWMASLRLKKWLQGNYPHFTSHYYRLFFSIFSVLSLLPILVLVRVLPDKPLYQIPSPLVFITITVQFICAVLLLLVLFQTDIWVFSGLQQALGRKPKQETFRADGIYRLVRHPAYSFGLIFLWLNPVMSVNLLVLIISSTVYIIVGAVLEERKLLAQFPEYAEYRRRVPMFIPRLWKISKTN